MKSHELAEKLKETAAFLLSRPDVPLGWRDEHEPRLFVGFLYEKDAFIAAAKAFGSGEKRYDTYDLTFIPAGAPLLHLTIGRGVACRKVQEEKWECEPLLSVAEDVLIGPHIPEVAPVTAADDIPF